MMTIPRYIQQIKMWAFFKMLFIRKIEFPENFLFFNSARGAIKWLLAQQKSLLKKKLNIGMPCYACYTVFQSVNESDNITILLDIDPLCFTLSDKLNEQIKKLDVLLWIDYFGFKYRAVLMEIRTRFPNLIIIEDCSQIDLRDYLKSHKNEYRADYTLFSFNFRKPITAGGGGLLVINEDRNTETAHYLYNKQKELSCEKIGMQKIVHILIYNFSYNYLIFLIFNKLISKKRSQTFTPEELPIQYMAMNRILKKLFYTQYMWKSEKERSENYTFNYFNSSQELMKKYSFGSLSYYPVLLSAVNNNSIYENVDKFMLWDNMKESYRFFNKKVSKEDFPLTFHFMTEIIFFPARFFKNPNTKGICFPCNKYSLT